MVRGRPVSYDWDDKKDICYKLYVEEKRSIPQIVKYFADHFKVPESELPSTKLFHRQFSSEKWDFPKRKNKKSPETDAYIARRMKEMWEQNMQLKDIQRALADEGYELSKYDFEKLKRKCDIARRGDVAYQPPPAKATKRKRTESSEAQNTEGHLHAPETSKDTIMERETALLRTLPPDEAARRAQRLAEIQAQSDMQLQSRKRRRRIRGFGHLPPDAPDMQPRYGSETSLDECKAYLSLDNATYVAIRTQFEAICVAMDIDRKKTSLESGGWQTAKDRLIMENMHLAAVMNPVQPDHDKKIIALDCICADVTKRMRDSKRHLTIGDANNALGLNPAASKELRRAFYEILEADQYTTRLACGDEHWQELRDQWHAGSPFLEQTVAEGDPHKLKCLVILCRDAAKRYNDDKAKMDPTRKQYQRTFYGPGPGAVKYSGRGSKTNNPAFRNKTKAPKSSTTGGPVDPALTDPPPPPIPAYFRLSAASQVIGNHPRMWLGKLAFPNITSLHAAALSKAGAANVTRIHGIIKNEDGSEASYQIDSEDELVVYLEAAGDKATFAVALSGGYA